MLRDIAPYHVILYTVHIHVSNGNLYTTNMETKSVKKLSAQSINQSINNSWYYNKKYVLYLDVTEMGPRMYSLFSLSILTSTKCVAEFHRSANITNCHTPNNEGSSLNNQ